HECKITPKIEFWAHCSNLQAWTENHYDTRIIHSNLGFPLLKELADAGDPIANRVFKDEIAKRFNSKVESVQKFFLEEGYLNYLSNEELQILFKAHFGISEIEKKKYVLVRVYMDDHIPLLEDDPIA
ncbi:unnamed protein product, partial [marine sediment metagenome]